MRKLIVAVKSCHRDRDRGSHDAIRSTWGAELRKFGVETRFFMGVNDRPSSPLQRDEVEVQCADSYAELPFKTREICRWASGKMLDQIFLTDNDTLVIPNRLVALAAGADYAGRFHWPHNVTKSHTATSKKEQGSLTETQPRCYGYASGAGYYLSRKAAAIVAYEFPNSWAEDLWVGQVMGPLAATGEIWVEEITTDYFIHPIVHLDRFESNINPGTAMHQAFVRYNGK